MAISMQTLGRQPQPQMGGAQPQTAAMGGKKTMLGGMHQVQPQQQSVMGGTNTPQMLGGQTMMTQQQGFGGAAPQQNNGAGTNQTRATPDFGGLRGVGQGKTPDSYVFNIPGFEPWGYVDTQKNLQQMQGYQQGLLEYLQSFTDRGNDSSLLNSMIGQGFIDQSTFDQIFGRNLGAGQGLVDAAQKIEPMLTDGLFSEPERQLIMDTFASAKNPMEQLANSGLFTPDQLAKLTGAANKQGAGADALASGGLFNQGEEARFNDIFNQIFGKASGAGETGGVRSDQEADFTSRLDQAGNSASNIAQTGGMDSDALSQLRSLFGEQTDRVTQTAGRGGLTDAEYQQQISAAKQNVLDQGKANAANTFNASNFTDNPFAAMALKQNANVEAGKAMGQATANANQYQADSRMKAEDQLRSIFDSGAGLESDVASGRRQGASLEGDLASKAGDFYLGQGGQRIQGIGQQGDLAGRLQDFLKDDAQGRVTGLDQQNAYTDQLRKIFGDNQQGIQQGIDAILKGGGALQDLFKTDNQGRLDAYSGLLDGSKLMNDLNFDANKYQSQVMPNFLQGLFNQSVNNMGGGNQQDTNTIMQILKLLQG